jgi:hypothetical protein
VSVFFSHAVTFFVRLLWAAVLAAALYVLTAPPLIIALTRKNPREWPRICEPLVPGFWCQWTRPIFVWYFDDLWQAETESRGE